MWRTAAGKLAKSGGHYIRIYLLFVYDQAVISRLEDMTIAELNNLVTEALYPDQPGKPSFLRGIRISKPRLLDSGDVEVATYSGNGANEKVNPIACASTLEQLVVNQITSFAIQMSNVDIVSMAIANNVDKTKTIEGLVPLNSYSLPFLYRPDAIRHIRWNKPAHSAMENLASPTLTFLTATQVNEAITQGLFWSKRLHKYHRQCLLSPTPRYDHCQQLGHTATECLRSAICKWCAGSHLTGVCLAEHRPQMCRRYGYGSHHTLGSVCVIIKAEDQKNRERRMFYPVEPLSTATEDERSLSVRSPVLDDYQSTDAPHQTRNGSSCNNVEPWTEEYKPPFKEILQDDSARLRAIEGLGKHIKAISKGVDLREYN